MTNEKFHEETNVFVPFDFSVLKPLCSDSSIEYLKESLRRLENGIAPTPSFPLYGKRDVSIVEDWMHTIDTSTLPEWFKEYERSRVVKFGPQGGVPKWSEIVEDVMLYKTAHHDVEYVDPEIMGKLTRKYGKLHPRLMGVRDVLQHLIRSDKIETRAAGWNQFQLKKTDVQAQQEAVKFALNGNYKKGYGYVFSRFNKQKKRIFMPMPFSLMLKQAQAFVPFMALIQSSLLSEKHRSPYVFWADKVGWKITEQIIERLLVEAAITPDEYLVYFSNDFIKMDTRTSTKQYDSFYLPIVFAEYHSRDVCDAIRLTTQTPIITPAGLLSGDLGTASGAETTNCGETHCNEYFQERMDKLLHGELGMDYRRIVCLGNGDDSTCVYAVRRTVPFDKFKETLGAVLDRVSKETGFDVQTEKLEISTEFGKYCQHVFSFDVATNKLLWAYPSVLILNAIVNPEKQYKRSDWDKDYRDIDIIQKLDNGTGHPLFHELIDFVRRGMKMPLLGNSEQETARILSKYDKYRSLQSLSERYNRQDYHISDSDTVEYLLRSKR